MSERATLYCPRCLTTFAGNELECPNLGCRQPRPAKGWGVVLGPSDLLDRRYRIERCLAVGGAGLTYLAQEVDPDGGPLGPRLAIKVLYSARATGPFLRRLSNEAQILQELAHDNIVQLRGFVHRTGHEPYLVTLFEEGGSLANHVARVGPLAPAAAAAVLRQILLALDVAHQRGVVHRDLKPDNVLLSEEVEAHEVPYVRVADFGIAKVSGGLSSKLTKVGSFVGTPEYAAPEQFEGQSPTPATDLFAAGGLLVFLLTGHPPVQFAHRNDIESSYEELLGQLPPTLDSREQPGISDADRAIIEEVLAHMMATVADERWTVHQTLHALVPLLGRAAAENVRTLDLTGTGAPARAEAPVAEAPPTFSIDPTEEEPLPRRVFSGPDEPDLPGLTPPEDALATQETPPSDETPGVVERTAPPEPVPADPVPPPPPPPTPLPPASLPTPLPTERGMHAPLPPVERTPLPAPSIPATDAAVLPRPKRRAINALDEDAITEPDGLLAPPEPRPQPLTPGWITNDTMVPVDEVTPMHGAAPIEAAADSTDGAAPDAPTPSGLDEEPVQETTWFPNPAYHSELEANGDHPSADDEADRGVGVALAAVMAGAAVAGAAALAGVGVVGALQDDGPPPPPDAEFPPRPSDGPPPPSDGPPPTSDGPRPHSDGPPPPPDGGPPPPPSDGPPALPDGGPPPSPPDGPPAPLDAGPPPLEADPSAPPLGSPPASARCRPSAGRVGHTASAARRRSSASACERAASSTSAGACD